MTDYKTDEFWLEYIFAVTEKGDFYRIFARFEENPPGERYRTIWSVVYGNERAWRYQDGGERAESRTPYLHISDDDLQDYLNGECSCNLKMVLDCYEWDSEIVEFFVVSNADTAGIPGASRLALYRVTKEKIECDIPTELQDVPTALFQDLKILKDSVHYIAGLCVSDFGSDICLIDWDVAFRYRDAHYSPKSDLFDVALYKSIVETNEWYRIKEHNLISDRFAVLPKAGVLHWEYADDAKFKIKQAPAFYFVDLHDERNLCNGAIDELLKESAIQEAKPVEEYEQLSFCDYLENDDALPF